MVPVKAPSNTTNTQTGLTLEKLTPTQKSQMCQEILEEIFDTIVSCSENGRREARANIRPDHLLQPHLQSVWP